MKEFDRNEFDEIFRAGLSAPDLNEVDEDWELMKARLQGEKKPGFMPYYLVIISSVAALFLVVFSLLFTADEAVQEQSPATTGIKSTKAPVPIDSGNQDQGISKVKEQTALQVGAPRPVEPVEFYYPTASLQDEQSVIASEFTSADLPSVTIVNNADSQPTSDAPVLTNTAETVTPENPILASKIEDKSHGLNNENTALSSEKSELEEQSTPKKSRLSLAINFAPDLNGVGQIQSDRLSYSIGAGLVYSLSKKVSIEAGAAYGRKSYQTGFSSFRPVNYNLFPIKPNQVSSGFDVMDIQLNMGYTVLKKGKSTIGVGGGISSYLMLDEQYSFTYPNIQARGLSSFHTGYQNNHFFGIANLNLSYKRNLTNNVQLAFDPYLKLPLTDLGYGNIRLRSAGINVGLITRLNKSKK